MNDSREQTRAWIVAAGLVTIAFCLLGLPASADEVPTRYHPSRDDDDFTTLRDPAKSDDFWDPIKYIQLGNPDTYVTFGGELRERLDHFSEPAFGLSHSRADENDLLQRFLLNADLHLGTHVRVFLQVGNYLSAGKGNLIGPTDTSRLDVQQAFIDLSLPVDGGSATVRIGRQEMSFGSQRLVSVREPPNIRRSFDGIRTFYQSGETRVDAFAVKPVKNIAGIFVDEPDPAQEFWGVYATMAVPAVPGLHADLYYLGLEHNKASYVAGVADEVRHTVGIRLFGKAGGWDYDTELDIQTGRFGNRTILAWAASSDTGYTFEQVLLTPRLGLIANIASGDRSPGSGDFGTFNPLFPKLGYFTEAELVIESNIIDLHPSIAVHPARGVSVSASADVLWRQNLQDGFYQAPFVPLIRKTSSGRYIGTEFQLLLDWQVDRHIDVVGSYVHFAAGPTITAGDGKSVDFVGTRIGYKF